MAFSPLLSHRTEEEFGVEVDEGGLALAATEPAFPKSNQSMTQNGKKELRCLFSLLFLILPVW